MLSPLKPYPRLQEFFAARVVDRWPSATRLANLIKTSQGTQVTIIHAEDDWEIVSTHADLLFYAAANATSARGLSMEQIDKVKLHEDLGMAGWSNKWTYESAGGKLGTVKQVIIRHGGQSSSKRYLDVRVADQY